MFKRLLIANRGEIALRVARACRELDIDPVMVYSEADRDALHVQLAAHAYCIGPAPAQQSYLNGDAILTVAKAAGCDAIHPGYGFLSENAAFAQECVDEGIAYVGPAAHVIATMGNKAAAREMMKRAGVPVVPGSDGSVANASEGARIAKEIGYPVLIKAAAGGGGRGMRRCTTPIALKSCSRRLVPNRAHALTMMRCISKSSSSIRTISSFRYLRTPMETSFTWGIATARFNAAVRR